MSFQLKAITRADHLASVRARPSVSHVHVGLVLLRPLPKLKRYLAYLPEGPVIDWSAPDLER